MEHNQNSNFIIIIIIVWFSSVRIEMDSKCSCCPNNDNEYINGKSDCSSLCIVTDTACWHNFISIKVTGK